MVREQEITPEQLFTYITKLGKRIPVRDGNKISVIRSEAVKRVAKYYEKYDFTIHLPIWCDALVVHGPKDRVLSYMHVFLMPKDAAKIHNIDVEPPEDYEIIKFLGPKSATIIMTGFKSDKEKERMLKFLKEMFDEGFIEVVDAKKGDPVIPYP